jgi:WD40 repeat protein
MGAKTKAPKTGTAPVNVNRKADIQRLHAEHTQEQITLMKKQSKFSNGNGAYFGAWNAQLNSFRLRLWNTSTKELILDYTGQSGEQMTAFSWPAVSSDDSMITTDQLILALGLSSGSIQLFDVAQKRVVGTLTSPISSASITDFIFASPSNSIGYSTMEDGSLFEWDLRQFKVKRYTSVAVYETCKMTYLG